MVKRFRLLEGLLTLMLFCLLGCGGSAQQGGAAADKGKKDVRLYDLLENAQLSVKSVDFPEKISLQLGLSEARYVIFLTDVNCSVCIVNYLNMSHFFVKNQNLCDSLITVAYGDQDFLKVEYFASKNQVERIPYERIYIDKPNRSVVQEMSRLLPGATMLVVENHRLVFACDFNMFKPDDEGDLKTHE